jgi:hypothetical protein
MCPHGPVSKKDTQAAAGNLRQVPIAAAADVPLTTDVAPRTVARVDVLCASQVIEHVAVGLRRVALTEERRAALIGLESQPVEILEEGVLVLRPAADAIMIFKSQKHASAECPRHTPRVNGIDDVA